MEIPNNVSQTTKKYITDVQIGLISLQYARNHKKYNTKFVIFKSNEK